MPAAAEVAVATSFESFFDEHRRRLFGALAVMCGSRAEAEEVMQDAFLRVWERWDRVAEMDSPEGYLYRVAMNDYRKRVRRAAVALRRTAGGMPAGDALEGIDTRDEVARLLRSLTTREREALVLTAYLGYSTEEAGSLLGIRASTVRALTTRARASLRASVEDDDDR